MKFNKTIVLLLISLITIHPSVNAQLDSTIAGHWDGAEYHENSQCQANWADRFFFQHYVFKGDESVLDIGSGDGKLTARIADQVSKGKVVGIDNADLMLKEAQKNFNHKANLSFALQDAQDREFYKNNANQFDLIVSFSTLHWVKDQKGVLSGIHHSLKNKGQCYLKLSSKGGDPIQDIADKLSTTAKYKTAFNLFHDPMTRFSPDEYKALLKEAKLKLISIRDSEEKDQIQGKENLIKQIKSWLPHYHYLKQHDKTMAEQYITEVIETYLQQYPADRNNNITLYDHYLEVIAEKD